MPRLRWMFVGALLVLLLLIMTTACFFEFQKLSGLWRDYEARAKILEEKESFVKNYREKIDFYKTPEGIVHLAREWHNMLRPGEKFFIIEDVPSSDNAANAAPERR